VAQERTDNMSVDTKRHDTYQVIRLETDMLMESDEGEVKNTVEQALRVGIKKFVFSVTIGSLANRKAISHLLLWCKETIWRNKGQLLFVEKNNGGESVFGALCESLHIPVYQDCETAVVAVAGNGKSQ
jgi:hypothetical protein